MAFLIRMWIIILLILAPLEQCFAQKLYVFYPTFIRPKTMQEQLQKSFPGIEVMVFGRYKDFFAKVNSEKPDAILTKTPLLEQFPDYKIKFSGVRKGEIKEKYVILSTNGKKSENKTIGVVNFLGRKELKDFLEKYFSDNVKIKHVNKMEDLLPLLTFNMVDGIFVSEKDATYFMNISNLSFTITELPEVELGIINLAITNSKHMDFISSTVGNMPKNTFTLLGVEKWQ